MTVIAATADAVGFVVVVEFAAAGCCRAGGGDDDGGASGAVAAVHVIVIASVVAAAAAAAAVGVASAVAEVVAAELRQAWKDMLWELLQQPQSAELGAKPAKMPALRPSQTAVAAVVLLAP